MDRLVAYVPNFSESRRAEVICEIIVAPAAPGVQMLDVHSWIYIGTQDIPQGTSETLAAAAETHKESAPTPPAAPAPESRRPPRN